MGDTASKLWALEEQFWLDGVAVYRQHLTEHSLMVVPGMVLTKRETEDSIAAGPRWTSVRFTDQRFVQLTPDTAALIYRASGSRASESAPYVAFVSSVYVQRAGAWKLALHQQSPLDSPR